MSLYNQLHGMSTATFYVLPGVLGIHPEKIERFRDARFGITEDGTLKFGILARTGGGNREDYPNDTLTSHDNYLYDEDVAEDITYAMYYFKIPYAEELKTQMVKDGERSKLADLFNTNTEHGKFYIKAAYKVYPRLTQKFNEAMDLNEPIPEGVEQL